MIAKMTVSNLKRIRKIVGGPRGDWRADAHRLERRVNRQRLKQRGEDFEFKPIRFTDWDFG